MIASEELIERLKSRDGQAVSELYDQYSPALYGVISRIIKIPSDAEAVLEKTFLTILEEIHNYKKRVNLFTWMFSIARAAAMEHMTLNASAAVSIQQETTPELFGGMPLLSQRVINCLYFQGHTVSQASATLNLSVEDVKNHLRCGLEYICNRKSQTL